MHTILQSKMQPYRVFWNIFYFGEATILLKDPVFPFIRDLILQIGLMYEFYLLMEGVQIKIPL